MHVLPFSEAAVVLNEFESERERKKRRKKMGLKLWLAQEEPRPQYDC